MKSEDAIFKILDNHEGIRFNMVKRSGNIFQIICFFLYYLAQIISSS